MAKYITLVLSLIAVMILTIYSGICCYKSLEGITTIVQPNASDASATLPNNAPSMSVNNNLPATISGTTITPLFDPSDVSANQMTKYNSDNLNVQYHDDLQDTNTTATGIYNTTMGSAKVYDVNGNLVDVVSNAVQGNIVYYQPGSYKYGATSYVPYYEDSVFLSRSTNAIVNTPTYTTTNAGGGFCNKYNTDPIQLEQQCNAINNETCAATTCCVLLGGQKCVAGNESGPIMKNNYSDFMVLNKDLYYYQGKCYGNCPNTSQFPTLPKRIPYMPSPPGDAIAPENIPNIPYGTPMPPFVSNIPPPPPGTL